MQLLSCVPLTPREGICGRPVSVGLCRNLLVIPALFSGSERSNLKRPLSERQASSLRASLPSKLKFREQEWAGYARSYHLDARRLDARQVLLAHRSGKAGRGTPPSSTRRTLFAEDGNLLLGNSVWQSRDMKDTLLGMSLRVISPGSRVEDGQEAGSVRHGYRQNSW